MKNIFLKSFLLIIAGTFLFSCNNDDGQTPIDNSITKKQVIENYTNIAYANYLKAYDDAVILETAIVTFTTTPTQVNFDNAKAK